MRIFFKSFLPYNLFLEEEDDILITGVPPEF